MDYEILPELFLRTPFFSYGGYDLERLPELLQSVVFRNAIRLASPVLYHSLEKKDFNFEVLDVSERHTLAKYYDRMCFRPTPFGHFAAFSLLRWGDGRPVQLAAEPDCRLYLLPEGLSTSATGALLPNPTLYRHGRNWRYYHTHSTSGERYQFTLDETPAGHYLNALLKSLRQAPAERDTLIARIGATVQCSPAEAAEYLDFLLAEQVLYTTEQGRLIRNEQPESISVGEPLPAGSWYAAVERPWCSGGPGGDDHQELASALHLLQRFARPVENLRLNKFIADFSLRFDRQKVPLLLALDPDSGVVYGEPASPAGGGPLTDLPFPAAAAPAALHPWGELQRLLLRRWQGQPGRGNFDPLTLTVDDLRSLPPAGRAAAPNTLAVMFRRAGDQLLFEQATTVSANQLLGRFSAFSEAVTDWCRRLAGLEEAANPGVCFADLGQRSDDHVDNINRRRPLYRYELPLNVASALPAAQQLLPADLYLYVRNGELILESAKLGKRVIPRLATAFNYGLSGSSLFKMLGDLQYQGLQPALGIELAQLFPGLEFYPRLVYGRTILSLAKWCFSQKELAGLLERQTDQPLESLRRFRATFKLPRQVMLGDTDRQLVFDLEEEKEAHFFLACLAGLTQITLQEYIPPGRSVKSGHQPLASQYLAFMAHHQEVYQAGDPSPLPKKTARSFPPGSDWLYLKLYCTAAAAEELLQQVIRPLVTQHRAQFSCWFFIRYADPEHHLRLRFQLPPVAGATLLAALQTALRRSGLAALVRELQTDTYRRELERYGSDLMPAVEKVFEAGSNWVLARTVIEFDTLLALTRQMTACFIPGAAAQHLFYADMAQRYLAEFKSDKAFRLALDRKYRALRPQRVEVLAAELSSAVGALAAAARAKSAAVRRTLLADLIHMQLNRSLVTAQRQQELLIYYCLEKLLDSELARARRNS